MVQCTLTSPPQPSPLPPKHGSDVTYHPEVLSPSTRSREAAGCAGPMRCRVSRLGARVTAARVSGVRLTGSGVMTPCCASGARRLRQLVQNGVIKSSHIPPGDTPLPAPAPSQLLLRLLTSNSPLHDTPSTSRVPIPSSTSPLSPSRSTCQKAPYQTSHKEVPTPIVLTTPDSPCCDYKDAHLSLQLGGFAVPALGRLVQQIDAIVSRALQDGRSEPRDGA